MPRRRKLKVFRTPIGFHDAYVAAPSRKAALEAWGSKHDLFARGMAEQVEDPELIREPLAQPGKVIRRSRGSPAEQIAALPKAGKRQPRKAGKAATSAARAAPKRAAKPQPRPDRSVLERAEAALAEAEARQRKERAAFARREAALAKERRRLEHTQDAETAKLARVAERERARYERAIRAWRG